MQEKGKERKEKKRKEKKKEKKKKKKTEGLQHWGFECGHPPFYEPSPQMLNFRVQMGSGVLSPGYDRRHVRGGGRGNQPRARAPSKQGRND